MENTLRFFIIKTNLSTIIINKKICIYNCIGGKQFTSKLAQYQTKIRPAKF